MLLESARAQVVDKFGKTFGQTQEGVQLWMVKKPGVTQVNITQVNIEVELLVTHFGVAWENASGNT